MYILGAGLLFFLALYIMFSKNLYSLMPVSSFALFFITGSFFINIIFSYFIFDSVYLIKAYEVYGAFVIFGSAFFAISFLFPPKLKTRDVIVLNTISVKKVLNFASVPFFVVALLFLYYGLRSGASFGTQEWRSSITESARGYEFLIFNSGAILLAILIANVRGFSMKVVLAIVVYALLLSVYGGRFILMMSILIGLYLRFIARKKTISLFWLFVTLVVIICLIVGFAALRYSFSESVDVDLEFLLITLSRQLAGPVFDFSLSYGSLNEGYATGLILDKLRVAALPFFIKSTSSISLGAYLAQSADRDFEFGHRIGGVGEVFYLAGFLGVVLLSFVLVVFCRFSEVSTFKAGRVLINFSVALFVIGFCFFIDFSYIFTGFYMYFYILFFVFLKLSTRR